MMIKVNPKWTDAEIETFRELIKSNEGYCPCSIIHDEYYKCICQEFIDKSENGECHCGLYIKEL